MYCLYYDMHVNFHTDGFLSKALFKSMDNSVLLSELHPPSSASAPAVPRHTLLILRSMLTQTQISHRSNRAPLSPTGHTA